MSPDEVVSADNYQAAGVLEENTFFEKDVDVTPDKATARYNTRRSLVELEDLIYSGINANKKNLAVFE